MQSETEFFRCPVPEDLSGASIRVGRRRFDVGVQEMSIDGLTVLVGPKEAPKLKVGRPWLLEHQDSITEVHPQWFFNSTDGHVQIGLRRLRDLTPPIPLRKSWLVRYGGLKYADPSNAAIVYGGFVLMMVVILALPGLGEQLGTSQKIENGLKWVVTGVDRSIQ